jgi:putative FmdB family regulatory protein
MPTYSYICTDCNSEFELFFYIKDYTEHPVCLSCGSNNTDRHLIKDAMTLNASVKKSDTELKTLGDLAQRNSDRMSNDEKQHLYTKHNAYKDEKDLKPLPTGMSRVKKKPKIKWPGSIDMGKKRRNSKK